MLKASGSLPTDDPLYAPGIKRRTRAGEDARYWLVPAKDAAANYPGMNRTIPKNASEEEAAAMCRGWWEDLLAWRAGRPKTVVYTFAWLCDRYKYDPRSPIHTKHPATQDNYGYHLKAIKASIGHLRFDPLPDSNTSRVLGADIREYHEGWGCPVEKVDEATGKAALVATAPSRARHMIMMLRTISSYGVEIGAPGAADLRQRLAVMTFPTPPARTKAPTYAQLDALVNKAEEMGYRSIAITTLAQYELIERRAHIIGQWHGDHWKDGWVWEGVSPEWVISYYQTKRGRTLREYDLRVVQRLLGLMQETPKEARKGPIIICEGTGQPWTRRYYAEVFREIARAAGVPDDIYSMDMRAGGMTEADDIPGVTPRMMQDGAGHADIQTQEIYRRGKQRNAQKVVQLRQAARDSK